MEDEGWKMGDEGWKMGDGRFDCFILYILLFNLNNGYKRTFKTSTSD